MRSTIFILALALAASSVQAQDDLYDSKPYKKQSSQKSNNSVTYNKERSYSSSAVQTQSSSAVSGATSGNTEELITTYDAALARRLSAMRNYTEQDDSYWKLLEQYQSMLERKYNQDLYNIVLVGNEMWVEPQFITAQFNDSDPAEGVVKYNNSIKSNLGNSSAKTTYSTAQPESNVTININVDPWYSNWGWSAWNRPYYGYNSYYSPYYSPYYNPWHGSWYDPWYRPWPHYYPYHNHYYPSYYGNPRGTYYGNSRYNSPTSGRGSYNSNAMGLGRSQGTYRPNGSNTVSGIGRSSSNVTGGVSSSRPTIGRPTIGRPSTGSGSGSTSRPSTTYGRPATSRPSTTYERPSTSRPSTTYERPSTSRPTFDRPSTQSRPSTTYDRPSAPSSPSIGRPSGGGGGMGGGRSTGGRR